MQSSAFFKSLSNIDVDSFHIRFLMADISSSCEGCESVIGGKNG